MKKKLPSLIVLCVIGLVAGLLLSLTDAMTAEPIAVVEASKAEAARASVLESAARFEELVPEESRYALDNLYAGYDADGETVGYVGQTTVTGFGGPIEVVAGVDMDGVITGISVGGADFAETAGLGAKTKDAAFTDQFKGKTPTIVLNEDGVDTVTGASTSSRAVISGVNAVANYIYTYELGLLEETTVYTGATTSMTVQGFGGDVTVTIGFADDGTIEYLAVDTPNETDGLGKMTSETSYTGQFLGKTGPFAYGEDGIEAVSGATVTSTAVLNAINEIVSGGGTASAEPVSATVQGFGGDVTVTARLNADNSIAALSIDTPNETDGLGKTASETSFTDQFIGKTAPFVYGENGIEAISGATVTSTAVINALNDIVPAGEAIPTAEEAVETESVEEDSVEAETVDTDAEPADEQTEVSEEVDATPLTLVPGTVTVTKETPFSSIDVTLTLSENAITEAVITSSGDNDLLTDDSRRTLSEAIVAAQGSDIDVISGVTISTDAVKEAVAEILANAKADEAIVEETEAASDAIYTAGEYTVTKETPFSNIDVTLTLSENAITEAVITSSGDNDLLTDDSRKTLSEAIVAAQGSDIDAISGVTISTDAIKEAVEELIAGATA